MKYRVTLKHGNIHSIATPYTEFKVDEPKIVDEAVVATLVEDLDGSYYNITTIIGDAKQTKKELKFTIEEWAEKAEPKENSEKQPVEETTKEQKKSPGRPKTKEPEGPSLSGLDIDLE
jgi:hypothetical protein